MMRRLNRLAVLVVAALVVPACAGSRAGPTLDRANASKTDLISREEMERQHWANAYDLVAALRPAWLNRRGPDTAVGTQVVLQVHVNGMRVGDVTTLHEIDVTQLAYAEFIDPIAATARWGLGYGHGAINLTTKGQ
jgi:hypothetical protein